MEDAHKQGGVDSEPRGYGDSHELFMRHGGASDRDASFGLPDPEQAVERIRSTLLALRGSRPFSSAERVPNVLNSK
jgi:hypothetical protein